MQDHKYKIKETFNNAAEGYDKPALRFFSVAAEHLANSRSSLEMNMFWM